MATPPPPSVTKPDVFQWVTFGIAVWGAVLATFVAAWNLYREYTNRGFLKVECHMAWTVTGGVQQEDQLAYSVTNVGRQPIVVTRVGGMHTKAADEPRQFIVTSNRTKMPRTLAPGELFGEVTDDLYLFEKPLEYLAAWDSLGNVYKASKRDMRRIRNWVRDWKRRREEAAMVPRQDPTA